MRLASNNTTMNQRGLTLIELLIAIAIFAIMATSMFIAFDNVQKSKEVTDRASLRLKAYQSTFNRIAQDLQQISPRPVRNEYGDLDYAVKYQSGAELQFTRTGWSRSSFFTKQQRSELQRVTYYLEDGKLMRAYWRSLDQAPGEQPVRTELLDGVREVSFRFFYRNPLDTNDPLNTLHEEWPPVQLRTTSPGPGTFYPERVFIILPNAIEIALTTDDLGTITRSFLVASGAEFTFK